MARVDLNAASAASPGQPVPEEVKLARELATTLHTFTDTIKNLTPMSAQSDPSLSNVSEIIKKLHELSARAAQI